MYPVAFTLDSSTGHIGDNRTSTLTVGEILATIRDGEYRLVDNDRPTCLGTEADNSFAGVEKCVAGGMTARAAGTERSS